MKTPSLKSLHSALHEQAGQVLPHSSGLPVVPARNAVPLTAQKEWKIQEDNGVKWLMKDYDFTDNMTRNRFVSDLLAFEEQVGYGAEIMIVDRRVFLRLANSNAKVPLDEDRAYAMFADDVYRDVTFSAFVP